MTVSVSAERLLAFLETCPDAENVGGSEYVLDIYDTDPPVTMDIAVEDGKVDVLSALTLLYDEESDGWYPDERLRDAGLFEKLLNDAIENA